MMSMNLAEKIGLFRKDAPGYFHHPNSIREDDFKMKRTRPEHFDAKGLNGFEADFEDEKIDFKTLIGKTMGKTNDLQMQSQDLIQQMIINPDSVDAHDVTLSMEKAEMSLTVMKSVLNKALTSYREIINLR